MNFPQEHIIWVILNHLMNIPVAFTCWILELSTAYPTDKHPLEHAHLHAVGPRTAEPRFKPNQNHWFGSQSGSVQTLCESVQFGSGPRACKLEPFPNGPNHSEPVHKDLGIPATIV